MMAMVYRHFATLHLSNAHHPIHPSKNICGTGFAFFVTFYMVPTGLLYQMAHDGFRSAAVLVIPPSSVL